MWISTKQHPPESRVYRVKTDQEITGRAFWDSERCLWCFWYDPKAPLNKINIQYWGFI